MTTETGDEPDADGRGAPRGATDKPNGSGTPTASPERETATAAFVPSRSGPPDPSLPSRPSEGETPAKQLEKVLKQRAAETRTVRSRSRQSSQPGAAAPPPSTGAMDASVEGAQKSPNDSSSATPAGADFDDFGLPIRKAEAIRYSAGDAEEEKPRQRAWSFRRRSTSRSDADHSRASSRASSGSRRRSSLRIGVEGPAADGSGHGLATNGKPAAEATAGTIEEEPQTPRPPPAAAGRPSDAAKPKDGIAKAHAREASTASSAGGNALSEFSHQQLTGEKHEEEASEDGGWQTMPAFAPYDIYDDDNRLIAKEHVETEEESYGYAGLGGAGKGYTRVLIDDDAESATSMDDNTNYLFKTGAGTSMMDDEEEQRDAIAQMQATKDLLTEGQRIAYVGITRLHLHSMVQELELMKPSKTRLRKELSVAAESMKMWSQKMMIRLYAHMDISLAEQVMIEQLSEHGVQPKDLTPALLANSRVKNPMADETGAAGATGSGSGPKPPGTPTSPAPAPSPGPAEEAKDDTGVAGTTEKAGKGKETDEGEPADDEEAAEPPPPYKEVDGGELPDVRTPSQMPTTAKIDIDLRWTVLCDLFLVLIADSVYDARSRVLLERVGESLDVPWIDICKFERKVTEALEMQQQAEKENWDEKDHMESRRKLALRRRYVMMGLATVGGGLVIGLSAGLLAPVIGAGLAAGFTTIGVTGTSSFLAGAGGAAIITSSAAASGSVIGGRAANRRTGAVKTFEYRPLHNNKRVNLIVTVSGWMTGKVDDVRLPYSTVDPVMGDIYSVLWEPEMLTSMGDTINILATEQLLGSTILVSLMAALQLPVVLTKLSYLIDNPWAVSLDRATMAGLILADSLIDRNLGTRPITLVGYSLGSRVIFSCLLELARKGAYGLVQNVFMFGSPVVVKQDEFMRARSVVAGRIVNGYNRNDWILGYLFRLTNGGIRRVAGLGPVDTVPNIENMDVTEFVVGHMDYRTAMPRLLRECGWLVESDEFTEIEDPDPENHAQRQRELINEIEEARKELEKEGKAQPAKKGGAFSFFSRKKKGEKQEWEIYEDLAKQRQAAASSGSAGSGGGGGGGGGGGKTEDAEGNNHGVLFDVDAIRAELAKERNGREDDLPLEQLQVRELKSTLPPMRLSLSPSPSSTPSPAEAAAPMAAVPALTPPVPTAPRPLHSPRPSLSGSNGSRRVTDSTVAYRASAHEFRSPSASASDHRISEERTPTLRAKQMTLPVHGEAAVLSSPQPLSHSRGAAPTIVDNEGISMTFDYAYDDAPPASKSGHGSAAPPPPPKDPAYARGGAVLAAAGIGAAGAAGAAALSVSSPSMPTIALSDPWRDVGDDYDDDDEADFGQEQEISMTFA